MPTWAARRPSRSTSSGPGTLLDNPTMASWKYRGANRFGSWEAVYSAGMVIPSRYYPIYVWLEITGSSGILWVNGFIGDALDRPPLEMYRDGEVTGFTNIASNYASSFADAGRDFADAILEGPYSRYDRRGGPRGAAVLSRRNKIWQRAPRGHDGRDNRLEWESLRRLTWPGDRARPAWSRHSSMGVGGIHDMGGVPGYGPVEPEVDEPVFHDEWEGRVFGLATSVKGGLSRRVLESLAPEDYLSGYYQRWMLALERGLVDRGMLSAEELDAKTEHFRGNPGASPTRDRRPVIDRACPGRSVPSAPGPQGAWAAARVRGRRPRAGPAGSSTPATPACLDMCRASAGS